MDFTEARVGGLSVGVPGTVRGWETALQRYGTQRLSSLLRPARRIAREGFGIDPTFNQQVTGNAEIFDDFAATRDLYLTRAQTAKPVGSVQRNPDMAGPTSASARTRTTSTRARSPRTSSTPSSNRRRRRTPTVRTRSILAP